MRLRAHFEFKRFFSVLFTGYCSPELLSGVADSGSVDVWSVGVMLLQRLAAHTSLPDAVTVLFYNIALFFY